MALTHGELVELAHRHAALEAGPRDNLEAIMATLDPDPVYSLWPVGREFRGQEATRRYYDHYFSTFQPMVSGYEMRGEYVGDAGVAQEYAICVRPDGGEEECHVLVAVLTFGSEALSGERVHASERMLRLLFGPMYDEAGARR